MLWPAFNWLKHTTQIITELPSVLNKKMPKFRKTQNIKKNCFKEKRNQIFCFKFFDNFKSSQKLVVQSKHDQSSQIVDKSPNLTTQKGTWTIFRRHFIPRFSSVVCESKILSCDCRVVTFVIATGNNSFQRILERNRIDPGTCNSCNRFRSQEF